MRPFDWAGLWRAVMPPWEVALRAAIIYLFVQLLLRLVGRKRLAGYRIHDVVLLFMISPALRQTLVGEDTSLTTAMVALGSLAGVDAALAYLIHRSRSLERILEGSVRRLIRDGRLLEDELHRSRITRDELLAQVRQHGHESLEDVEQAFLERSGRISLVFRELARR
jgi:uncharacterized membrane protein YcaP (DUF421 family)